MGLGFNYDRAAIVLADAKIIGDSAASEKYSVPESTLKSWRSRCKTDERLSSLFLSEYERLRFDFREDSIRALRKVLQAIEDLADEAIKEKSIKSLPALIDGAAKLGELVVTDRELR